MEQEPKVLFAGGLHAVLLEYHTYLLGVAPGPVPVRYCYLICPRCHYHVPFESHYLRHERPVHFLDDCPVHAVLTGKGMPRTFLPIFQEPVVCRLTEHLLDEAVLCGVPNRIDTIDCKPIIGSAFNSRLTHSREVIIPVPYCVSHNVTKSVEVAFCLVCSVNDKHSAFDFLTNARNARGFTDTPTSHEQDTFSGAGASYHAAVPSCSSMRVPPVPPRPLC